jgi:hypothetical protein
MDEDSSQPDTTHSPTDPLRPVHDAIYAIGNNRGNNERMTCWLSRPSTREPPDMETADKTNLRGIFPTDPQSIGDKIMLIGGYDGNRLLQ